ncbi:MAG: tetratricopeptide repeat protein [Oligoflexia bacterium]|nr:tetratricopeptide repeat protein [Oligoflexia bacterium]
MDLFKSEKFLEDGKHHVSEGELDLAIESFQKSIESRPTAEAYTLLAWVLSLKEQFDLAIELCQKAIDLNPQFGNPYNDIGSYLIQKGKFEEAIPWLQKAKESLNYETKHFPYINMGRIYTTLGQYDDAIEQFKGALSISPGHKEIQKVLEELESINNA